MNEVSGDGGYERVKRELTVMVSGIPVPIVPELHLISGSPDQVIWNVCIYIHVHAYMHVPIQTVAAAGWSKLRV